MNLVPYIFDSSFADIVQVDLVTGTSFSLLNSNLGHAHRSNVDKASFLAICGDIAQAVVKSVRSFFFINWKTQSCITLNVCPSR